MIVAIIVGIIVGYLVLLWLACFLCVRFLPRSSPTMGILSLFKRRADDEAAMESVQEAAAAQAEPNNRGRWRFRDNDVIKAAQARWSLSEDQLEFLRKLLDALGPLLLVLLRAFLKV